ncbi:hypothetical protein [Metabacillus iocasae]|uniref:Uncharacterized protein n=1 Tax=Priestia iocasae TaxID=2291674 RepID=A0ABS2QTT6_9BACI|nr:hypothetical protein [Metabacillus iocasae]MBM7702881.1 hypothetical protein [Metabacillus iocasae]
MKKWLWIVGLIAAFLLLHIHPHTALRTHVFLLGYPKAAVTSGIIDDTYHNDVDGEKFENMNAKAYTLTEPPIEKATQGELRNYLVKKIGFIYVAEYYGEL